MEFAITIAIVAAAVGFVLWRWIRSVRRASRPAPFGDGCGDCDACGMPAELRTNLDKNPPPGCDEIRKEDATPPGGR